MGDPASRNIWKIPGNILWTFVHQNLSLSQQNSIVYGNIKPGLTAERYKYFGGIDCLSLLCKNGVQQVSPPCLVPLYHSTHCHSISLCTCEEHNFPETDCDSIIWWRHKLYPVVSIRWHTKLNLMASTFTSICCNVHIYCTTVHTYFDTVYATLFLYMLHTSITCFMFRPLVFGHLQVIHVQEICKQNLKNTQKCKIHIYSFLYPLRKWYILEEQRHTEHNDVPQSSTYTDCCEGSWCWKPNNSWSSEVAVHLISLLVTLLMSCKGKAVRVHATEAHRDSRCIAPLTLNLGIRWRQVVRFTPQLLYSWGSTCWMWGWVGPTDGLDVLEKRKPLLCCLLQKSVQHPVFKYPQTVFLPCWETRFHTHENNRQITVSFIHFNPDTSE